MTEPTPPESSPPAPAPEAPTAPAQDAAPAVGSAARTPKLPFALQPGEKPMIVARRHWAFLTWNLAKHAVFYGLVPIIIIILIIILSVFPISVRPSVKSYQSHAAHTTHPH